MRTRVCCVIWVNQNSNSSVKIKWMETENHYSPLHVCMYGWIIGCARETEQVSKSLCTLKATVQPKIHDLDWLLSYFINNNWLVPVTLKISGFNQGLCLFKKKSLPLAPRKNMKYYRNDLGCAKTLTLSGNIHDHYFQFFSIFYYFPSSGGFKFKLLCQQE